MPRKKRGRTRGRRAGRGTPRPAALRMTGGTVAGNLAAARQGLLNERSQIDRQIAILDQALSMLSGVRVQRGPAPAASRKRGGGGAFRSGSLKDHIHQVLARAGSPMAVKDITERVTASGFTTRNKTLAKSVGIALTQMPGVVKVGRGMFKIG